jgi:hypothetical protein
MVLKVTASDEAACSCRPNGKPHFCFIWRELLLLD